MIKSHLEQYKPESPLPTEDLDIRNKSLDI